MGAVVGCLLYSLKSAPRCRTVRALCACDRQTLLSAQQEVHVLPLRSTGCSDGRGCVLPVQKRTMMACRACALCPWPSHSALLRARLHAHCLKSTAYFNERGNVLPAHFKKRTSTAC